MATKINTAYYGLPENWDSVSAFNNHAKWSQYRFGALINDNKWNISAGDMPDMSIVPWGIPHCSISSMAYTISCRDSGRYKKIIHENDSRNVPIMFAGNYGGISYSAYSGATDTNARTRQKNRIVGETNFNNDNLIYTNTVDNGTIPDPSQSGVQGYAMTYIDYQSIRTVMRSVRLGNFAAKDVTMPVKDVNFNVLKSQTESTGEDWQLLSISPTIAIDSNTTAGGLICPTICAATPAPPHLANRYFDSPDTKMMNIYRRIFVPGCLETRLLTTLSSLPAYNDIISGAKTTSFPVHNIATQYQNISAKKQVFDDVSYHWDIHIRYGTGSTVTYYDDGDQLPAGTSNISVINHLVIDESIYTNKFESIYHACLHELAFLGLPIVEVVGDLPAAIGSNKVYLPIFDTEHMMTTGNYTKGADSMRYINAYWGDIFADTVPVWDPEYIPPDPTIDNSDWGDLDNSGANRHYNVPLYIQACNELTLQTIIANVNNYYAVSGIPTADDVYRLQTDFQGSNPADYIVACYVPFVDIDVLTQQHFRIGPITFDGNGNTEINILPIDDTDSDNYTFDCGNIYVPYYMQGENDTEHNDFRAYEPYTTAELYLPLCGTIDIDMKFFAGSYMNVIYYFDLFTMSCTAAVYRIRDGKSKLYTVVNGVIGVELPLTTSAMGTYQNNLHAIQTALKQNEIRIATSAATMAIGATATVATGGTAALLGAGGIVSGTSSLFGTYLQREQLQYELTHTQPNIGSTSAAHAQNQFCVGGLYPVLFIKRALMLDTYDPDIYSRTIGNSCCINALVGDMSGLIICSDIKCDGITNATGDSPTADEINAIKQAFNHGVIV